jgi:hypothetical protein
MKLLTVLNTHQLTCSSTEEDIIALCLQQRRGQQRAFDVAKQFSVIANNWKEEKVTANTP